MSSISRRTFIKIASATAATIGTADAATAVAPSQRQAADAATRASTAPRRTTYGFLNAQEAAFVEAAVARLIPSDDLGAGAMEADVAGYIDKQLAGAWGAGERLYRSGPFARGAPTQGYQLPYTPAELFRTALRGIQDNLQRTRGTTFAKLPPAEQDAFLKALEKSTEEFNGVPGSVFFDSLLAMTVEGFFCDPVYGGNRDMVGWKLIGFPGAYADYYEYVDQYNVAFTREPMSLAQDARGTVHLHPDIPSVPGKPASGRTKGK